MPQHHLPTISSDRDLMVARLTLSVPPPDKRGGLDVAVELQSRGRPLTTYVMQRLVGLETDLLPTLAEDFASCFLVGEDAGQVHKTMLVNLKAARAHRRRYELHSV